ncbi:MAG: HAMP domain-containing protein [bacterium]|nr:HAMP domain-containing protein [bacterium]
MTIKHKLLGNALFTSALMLVILATLVLSLGKLQQGLLTIVNRSEVGTEMSRATKNTLGKVSTDLSATSAEMEVLSNEIAKTTQAIKINQRKIASISKTMEEFSKTLNLATGNLPDGETRWDLEDLSDELMDIQDSLKKEALVGLTNSANLMTEFSTQVEQSAVTNHNLVIDVLEGSTNSQHSLEAAEEISTMSASFGESFAGQQKLLTGLIVLAVIFSIVMGVMTIRGLIPPLEKAVVWAEGIAGGDLEQEIHIKGNDEIGQLGQSMKKMIVELAANRGQLEANAERQQTLIEQVTNASMEIAAGSTTVANTSSVLSRGAVDQAASLEEVNSSMDLITTQIKSTADNAHRANSLAESTQKSATKGVDQTEDLNLAMNNIHKSSSQISSIIKTIDDIAFQTNLLALNAAVEAARAGKHGKGFAVVAEEVRNLAGRSSKAARETAKLIEESVERTDRGLQSVSETSEILNEIGNSVYESVSLVAEIAQTAQEQASSISEIRDAINQVGTVVQETANSAQETASASEVLSGQSEQLKQLLVHDTSNVIPEMGTAKVDYQEEDSWALV